MEIYNTIYYQKQFHQTNKIYQNTPPELYLTKLINNNFKLLSILYKYPFKIKHNSILQGFTFTFKLENNTKFTLYVKKGKLVLDSTLIEIEEDFELVINDISISNYRYCNILFTVNFDYDKYVKDPSPSNLPIFNLYLYDSITGELYIDNQYNNFDVSKTIVIETYSIYYLYENNFTIVPYRSRLKITDVYDKYNYLYLNPPPSYQPKPYPNVSNDIPDYTHDHIMTHNHCFDDTHDHNSNLELIYNYYSEKIKISENLNPPPQNIINNILSINDPILDILSFEYPILLELFNKCNLEIIDINNLSFDFRYIDPYLEELLKYEKNKYNYSKIIDYRKIEYNKIVIKHNNFIFYFPIRTHYYWLYILLQHDYEIDNIDFFNSLKYKYIYEDNIYNFGCFCK